MGSETGDDTESRQLNTHMQNDEKGLHDIMVRERVQAIANPLEEYSILKRLEIWRVIAMNSFKYPLGRGQGTSGYAHSYYFQTLSESGFPGLFLYLAILVFAFQRGLYVIRKATAPLAVLQAKLFLSLVFAFSVLNLTGTHLHSNPGDIYFWFSIGALAFLYQQCRREEMPIISNPEPSETSGVERNA